jgi:ABC-2 type transport system ATP-binding protein
MGAMTTAAIRTDNLGRIYQSRTRRGAGPSASAGPRVALDGVTLEVPPGELFGLLGPNGAGKTTLIKILTTLLAPSSGAAWVDGLDVVTQARCIRPRINMVSGGESSGYGVLNVRENLWLFTQLYGVPRAEANRRIDRMLSVVGLADRASTKVSHLSTGLRQKMNFCRGFVTDPKILFLDEPTLGLDVTSARSIRGFLREWMGERAGRTLLLTTHYMAEADELCDRIAIIDGGKVLACDTPAALKRQVQQYPVFELTLAPGLQPLSAEVLSTLPGVRQATISSTPEALDLRAVLEAEEVVGTLVPRVVETGARIQVLRKVEPTLEDVFIALVGHGLGEKEES